MIQRVCANGYTPFVLLMPSPTHCCPRIEWKVLQVWTADRCMKILVSVRTPWSSKKYFHGWIATDSFCNPFCFERAYQYRHPGTEIRPLVGAGYNQFHVSEVNADSCLHERRWFELLVVCINRAMKDRTCTPKGKLFLKEPIGKCLTVGNADLILSSN